MRMILPALAMTVALFAARDASANPPDFSTKTPAQSPAPLPDLGQTQLHVVPPARGNVAILDGETALGKVGLPVTLTVTTGKTYDVLAARSGVVLWRGSIQASGGTVELVWGDGEAPTIRMIPPPVVVTLPAPGTPSGPFVPPKHRGMKRGELEGLVALLESSSFEKDKLEVVKTAAARHTFTVAQVGAILETLDFDSDRLKAVTMLKDRIVDPENAFLLAKSFDFSSDKQKVAALFSR